METVLVLKIEFDAEFNLISIRCRDITSGDALHFVFNYNPINYYISDRKVDIKSYSDMEDVLEFGYIENWSYLNHPSLRDKKKFLYYARFKTNTSAFSIGQPLKLLDRNDVINEFQFESGIRIFNFYDICDFDQYQKKKKNYVLCKNDVHYNISILYLLTIDGRVLTYMNDKFKESTSLKVMDGLYESKYDLIFCLYDDDYNNCRTQLDCPVINLNLFSSVLMTNIPQYGHIKSYYFIDGNECKKSKYNNRNDSELKYLSKYTKRKNVDVMICSLLRFVPFNIYKLSKNIQYSILSGFVHERCVDIRRKYNFHYLLSTGSLSEELSSYGGGFIDKADGNCVFIKQNIAPYLKVDDSKRPIIYYSNQLISVDYSSFYPSILIEALVDYTTVIHKSNNTKITHENNRTKISHNGSNVLLQEYRNIYVDVKLKNHTDFLSEITVIDTSVPKDRTILPFILSDLLNKRKQCDKTTDSGKIFEKVLKLCANAIIGSLGADSSLDFKNKYLGAIVTQIGRNIQKCTVKYFESSRLFKMIMVNTDGAHFVSKLSDRKSIETVTNVICKEINSNGSLLGFNSNIDDFIEKLNFYNLVKNNNEKLYDFKLNVDKIYNDGFIDLHSRTYCLYDGNWSFNEVRPDSGKYSVFVSKGFLDVLGSFLDIKKGELIGLDYECVKEGEYIKNIQEQCKTYKTTTHPHMYCSWWIASVYKDKFRDLNQRVKTADMSFKRHITNGTLVPVVTISGKECMLSGLPRDDDQYSYESNQYIKCGRVLNQIAQCVKYYSHPETIKTHLF